MPDQGFTFDKAQAAWYQPAVGASSSTTAPSPRIGRGFTLAIRAAGICYSAGALHPVVDAIETALESPRMNEVSFSQQAAPRRQPHGHAEHHATQPPGLRRAVAPSTSSAIATSDPTRWFVSTGK